MGLDFDFIRPGKPVENSYIESFNGRLRDECLNVEAFFALSDVRDKLARWRDDYNQVRPHSALRDATPAAFTRSSQRTRSTTVARAARPSARLAGPRVAGRAGLRNPKPRQLSGPPVWAVRAGAEGLLNGRPNERFAGGPYLSPLRSPNAGQTGLNRLREAEFSTFTRPTFAGQVTQPRSSTYKHGQIGEHATGEVCRRHHGRKVNTFPECVRDDSVIVMSSFATVQWEFIGTEGGT